MHAPILAIAGPQLAAVPDAAPPYDCQAHGTTCPSPAEEPELAGLDSVAPVPVTPVSVTPVSVTLPGARDPATAWPRQFAQATIEALAGTRPFRQVIPSTTERVQAQIQRLIPLLRTGGAARIRRILASPASPDVVEVTAIAEFGPRTRAIALRFEHIPARPAAPGLPPRPARWLCTDIEAG